jgi:hypothetical protein
MRESQWWRRRVKRICLAEHFADWRSWPIDLYERYYIACRQLSGTSPDEQQRVGCCITFHWSSRGDPRPHPNPRAALVARSLALALC